MSKRILVLGSTGKMGLALRHIFREDYLIFGKNSHDFDALNFEQVRTIIGESSPDIVINTVAFLGIDPCEKEPERAFRLNTLYPKYLAELSNERGFLLIHFSTDAVFNDRKVGYYSEKDCTNPLNIYGFTKYGADCFIQAISKRYYIFRISVQFGETKKNDQFVEKMLQRIKDGNKVLNISTDIVCSPSYSKDVAREIKKIIEGAFPYGLYHVANEGIASLYDLMKEIVQNLNLEVEIRKASFMDFPYMGIKNTYTPIKSEKIPPIRPWQEALREYCGNLH